MIEMKPKLLGKVLDAYDYFSISLFQSDGVFYGHPVYSTNHNI